MENIPIPEIDDSMESKISEVVDRIIKIKEKGKNVDVLKYEHQIDQLVYKLYDLTPDEIAIVEGNKVSLQ